MQLTTETDKQTALTQFKENWIWHALLCLIDSNNFNSSPRWIANKLNITVEKAVDALEGLQSLELIERSGDTYRVTTSYHQIFTNDINKNELLKNHIRLASQILTRLDENDGYTVQFFTGNKELLKKYGPKFLALYKEMADEAKRMNITDVMASEISFVQLTKDVGGDV